MYWSIRLPRCKLFDDFRLTLAENLFFPPHLRGSFRAKSRNLLLPWVNRLFPLQNLRHRDRSKLHIFWYFRDRLFKLHLRQQYKNLKDKVPKNFQCKKSKVQLTVTFYDFFQESYLKCQKTRGRITRLIACNRKLHPFYHKRNQYFLISRSFLLL